MVFTKFSVGYPTKPHPKLIGRIVSRADAISEVYFAFASYASGRGRQSGGDALVLPWESHARQAEEAYDMIGTVTQALNAYSCDYVTPAIYKITLKTKNVHDEDSVRMLDMIRANRRYSFDACDEAQFPLAPGYSVRYLIGGQKTKDIASYYKKNEKKAQKWIDDIISAYEN